MKFLSHVFVFFLKLVFLFCFYVLQLPTLPSGISVLASNQYASNEQCAVCHFLFRLWFQARIGCVK